MTTIPIETDIDQLNSFLRGEIAAVETYSQAFTAAEHAAVKEVLQANQVSHAARVEMLNQEVKGLGGEPADGSGAWGAFAKAIEGGAKIFGESAAITALEEGEEHGLKDYKQDYSVLSTGARQLVVSRLLPEQQRTRDALARLKAIID